MIIFSTPVFIYTKAASSGQRKAKDFWESPPLDPLVCLCKCIFYFSLLYLMRERGTAFGTTHSPSGGNGGSGLVPHLRDRIGLGWGLGWVWGQGGDGQMSPANGSNLWETNSFKYLLQALCALQNKAIRNGGQSDPVVKKEGELWVTR